MRRAGPYLVQMRTHVLHREQVLPGTPEQVFGFFADARNLEAITPPLLRFEVVTPGEIPMRVGTLIQYRLHVRGVGLDWLTSIQEWDPPRRFVDTQVRGPYALWHHTHEFEPHNGGRTLMRDTVRWAVGFGPLGTLAARAFVARDVAAIFAFRRDAVLHALKAGGFVTASPPSALELPSSPSTSTEARAG
jgi:ligand-binding SRPBCC domain-containing protein